MPNPGKGRVKKFKIATQIVMESRNFFEQMERDEMVTFFGTPDARKPSDVRRTILCVTIFNLWLDIDRELPYPGDFRITGPAL
jgi:hypothetical protein